MRHPRCRQKLRPSTLDSRMVDFHTDSYWYPFVRFGGPRGSSHRLVTVAVTLLPHFLLHVLLMSLLLRPTAHDCAPS